MPIKLAIDFGTTNSVVAAWDEAAQAVRLLYLPGLSSAAADASEPLIPTLLYILDGAAGDALLGQAVIAADLHRQGGPRLFRNFKRALLDNSSGGPRLIDGVPWTEQDAGRVFLQALLGALPYNPHEIEELILTAPVAAFDRYLAWLSADLPGLPSGRVRLLDESSAAALGYAVTEPDALVLVVDFGGGSLDLSLVRLPERGGKTGGLLETLRAGGAKSRTARVVAKMGVNLGGSDIDRWLLDDALLRIGRTRQDLGPDDAAALSASEAAKQRLSALPATDLSLEVAGESFNLTVERQALENLLERQGFYDLMLKAVDTVMHQAQRRGFFKEDVAHVLLVGGTSLIPSVQGQLRAYFADRVVQVDKPFTAVAQGALQMAAGFGLQDFLAHSYGLRCYRPDTGIAWYEELIPAGSAYPLDKPVSALLGAGLSAQSAIELRFGAIEVESLTHVEVQYDEGRPVFVAQAGGQDQQIIPLQAKSDLSWRVPLDPPVTPGEPRLRVSLWVDEQRQLRLQATDLRSRQVVMENRTLVTVGADAQDVENAAEIEAGALTGFEPYLVTDAPRSERRLSLRRLGTLLNMLSPQQLSLDAAREAIKSDQFYVRYQAAELLSRRGDRPARAIVEEFMQSGTAPQRAAVAAHLHYFTWYAAEPLLRQALVDRDPRVRESAIYALCRLRGHQAFRLLVEAVQIGDDRIKSAAVWGLARDPDTASLPVLVAALEAGDPAVRVHALEVIGELKIPAAIPPVVRIFNSDLDLDVRYAATLSWVELAGADCFPELARAIASASGPERQAVLLGLFHASNYTFTRIEDTPYAGAVLDAVQAVLTDDFTEARLTVVMLLAWMQNERALALLRQAYQGERDADLKAKMLYAVASLMSPLAQEFVRSSVQDEQLIVRQTGAHILATHRGYRDARPGYQD